MSEDSAELNRVYWSSRRGMLELDLVLMPFARDCYPILPATDQKAYRQLLEAEDTELFAWFLQKSSPEDAVLAAIVSRVLEFARTRPL